MVDANIDESMSVHPPTRASTARVAPGGMRDDQSAAPRVSAYKRSPPRPDPVSGPDATSWSTRVAERDQRLAL